MAEHVLDAMAMARAVVSDPQFRFPARPRLVPGLVRIPSADGLLVEGGPARQSFQGSSATGLLGRVMDAVDGTTAADELPDTLQLPKDKLWPVLSLLYTTGLLEDAETADGATDVANRTDPRLAFLSRSIDTTRVNVSGAQAADRWRQARVELVGDAHLASFTAALAAALRADGAGQVTTRAAGRPGPEPDDAGAAEPPATAAGTPPADGRTLLITIGDAPQVRAAALDARAAGVPVLPIRPAADRIGVGPLLDAVHTACARCAAEQSVTPDVPAGPPAAIELAAALIARDVFTMLSRVGTSSAERYLVTTELDGLRQTNRAITPDPACVVCMDPPDPGRPATDGIPLAWAYTHAVAFPPRSAVNPRDHQVHYNSGNIALQQRHRRWPSSPQVPLASLVDADPANLPGGVNRDTVGHLLIRMAGLRNGPSGGPQRVDRWCPTGGNLGSVSAYLLARSVPGLLPGVYGFSRAEPALARLTWADPHTPIRGVADDADAVLVLTGALDVVAGKYGPFSWRILHLDAGVALTQAQRVATGLGLSITPAVQWDDHRLGELLGSTSDAEPITAVAALRAAGPAADPATDPVPHGISQNGGVA